MVSLHLTTLMAWRIAASAMPPYGEVRPRRTRKQQGGKAKPFTSNTHHFTRENNVRRDHS